MCANKMQESKKLFYEYRSKKVLFKIMEERLDEVMFAHGLKRRTNFEQIDINKFCSIPAFFQNNQENIDGKLLLQLHTNWLPFYINAGGEPTMYVFLNEEKERGFILIEDL